MCKPTQTKAMCNQTDAKAVDCTIDYKPMVNELRSSFASGKTKDLAWRRQQLKQLKLMVSENHEQFTAAVLKDLGGMKFRGLLDLMGCVKEADFALKNLEKWTAPMRVAHDDGLPINLLSKSEIRYEAKGVILIIAPWNYPIELCLTPLVSAIAAGNCAVVKPSEVSVHSTAALAKLLPKYMDQTCIRLECGAVPETTALLAMKWEHIMYTGNGAVARIVMAAAAKHLTPVTLELGGKSPVYIDKSVGTGAQLDLAVERISFAKWMNVGQTCIAPDYVLVHEDVKEAFLRKMKRRIESAFGSTEEARSKCPDLGRIISARHAARLAGLAESTSGSALVGGVGAGTIDVEGRYIPPTILVEPGLSDAVMREEIFGPILPVLGVASAGEAVATVGRVCDKPLALYVYAQDRAVSDAVVAGTASGGVCVNSSVEHFLNHHLPFGGVGGSGIGCSHGKHGFDEFTHRRAVMCKDTTLLTQGIPFHDHPAWLYDQAARFFLTGYSDLVSTPAAVATGVLCAATAAAAVACSFSEFETADLIRNF